MTILVQSAITVVWVLPLKNTLHLNLPRPPKAQLQLGRRFLSTGSINSAVRHDPQSAGLKMFRGGDWKNPKMPLSRYSDSPKNSRFSKKYQCFLSNKYSTTQASIQYEINKLSFCPSSS